jgi:hypothetical protein
MKTCLGIAIAVMFGFVGHAAAQAQESSTIQRPVRQQDIDRLKRQIDDEAGSHVEAIFDYHSETGDLNNRLNSFRYGGRLNVKFGSASAFQFTGTRTNYLAIDNIFNRQGTNFTAGVQTKLAEYLGGHFEAGVTRFTDTSTVNAHGSVTYSPSDNTRFYVQGSRSNVEESLLSTSGIRPVAGPFAGQLVGRVMENRFVVGGSSRLDLGIDVFGEGGVGTRQGSNVPSNFFKTIGGGAGYGILTRPDGEPLALLRGAYEFNYFSFNEDRSGFGGASLLTRRGVPIASARIGSDAISPTPGISNAGVGGYFSPENFVSNIARVEAKGGSNESIGYTVSAFIGAQDYTGSTSRLAKGLSATVTAAVTERVSLPVTYVIDNFGPFRQQSLFARLAYRF